MKVLAALMIVICCAHAAARELKIPEVGDLPRIDRNSPRPTREALRTSAYILKFKEHAPIGNGYVILTDHSEEDFLKPLEKLAKYREATLIKAGNLAELHQPHVLHNLRNRLVKLKPKYALPSQRLYFSLPLVHEASVKSRGGCMQCHRAARVFGA